MRNSFKCFFRLLMVLMVRRCTGKLFHIDTAEYSTLFCDWFEPEEGNDSLYWSRTL